MYVRARTFVKKLLMVFGLTIGLGIAQHVDAAILVTSTANSGAGTLRQAITDANTSSGPDIIEFAIGSGTTTITLTTDLPTSTQELTINGWTQPGWSNFPIISIRPTISATRALGCSAKCTIQGIGGYGSSAHFFQLDAGSDNSVLKGNWIGVNTTTAVFAFSDGLYVNAPNVVIGGTGSFDRNVINGSTASITLTINANNTSVIGNYIGTNATGTVGSSGSLFINGADNVIIGGTTVAERNVLGSNATMVVARYGADNLKIYGNYFGFRPDGTLRIANTVRSITVASSTNIEIGTSTQAAPQLLMSHIPAAIANIAVSTTLVTNLQVYNNYFNLIASGLVTTGTGYGLQMDHTSSVTIGGSGTNERNYFNVGGIDGDSIQNISIKNNYFGSDILGTTALGAPRGVTFTNVTSLYMGGDTDAERNVMLSTNSGNYGLSVTGGDQLYIKGNYWGVNPSGIQTIYGVWQVTNFTNVTNVQFGSTTTKQIMGSLGGGGIVITNVTSVAVYNNIIGSNIQQSASLSSAANTFRLTNATSVIVGGTNPNEGNVFVSTNQATFFDRVYDMTFYGNIFNLNASGSAQLGGGGILIRDSKQLIFGGSDPGEGNVISALSNGLFLDATAYIDRPLNATIEGNTFGFNASGTRTFRSSTDSIFVDQGYTDVFIKNNSFGWANFANVELWRNRNVTIQGNYFGYTSSTSLFSGTRRGVYQWETTSTNIGGYNPGESNYFGTSSQAMIDLERSTTTRVYGNYFGVTTAGRMLVGTSSQILVDWGMYDVNIGGTTTGMSNYITNAANGLYVVSSTQVGVYGNAFGMSPTTTGHGFTSDAIFIGPRTTSTFIGDGTAVGANSIMGGGFAGIELFQATSTVIYGNFFGTNTTTNLTGSNDYDLYAEQTFNLDIGGSGAGQGNLFGHSNFESVFIANLSRNTTIKGNTFGTSLDHSAVYPINGTAIYFSGAAISTSTVGGFAAGEGNWVANADIGIEVDPHGTGGVSIIGNVVVSSTNYGIFFDQVGGRTTVQGNYVGIDTSNVIRANGTGVGVDLSGTAGNIIFGGTTIAEQNVVVGNTNKGVTILSGSSLFTILRNRIYGNGGLQVDLGNDGPTANDLLDVDVGANDLLNFPKPLGVNGLYAGYTYSGLASQPITMDVYFTSSTDSFGRGQLMQYATSVNFTTDGSGIYTNYVDVASYGYVDTDKVVFLAHNASNTSEISGGTGGLLGIALAVSSTDQFDNTSDVEFTYTLVNYGSDSITNVQLEFSRALFFPSVSGITIVSAPVSSDPNLTIDGSFEGDVDTTMLNAAASTLNGNTTATISFTINVPHSPTALFSGYATTTGSVLGFSLEDVSASGTVPDTGNGVSYDGDLDPTNNLLITTLNLPTYTPPTPEVTFVVDTQTVTETAGVATVNIALEAATSATDVVATYSVGGTASDPADFTTPSGSFTILAGESATSIQVTLTNDMIVEADKTIILTLTSVTPNATTGATTTHTITLQSEDVPPPPELQFTGLNSSLAENGGSLEVLLELSATDTSNVDFTYSVSGTATTIDDYGALTGSGSILAGDTTTSIMIPIVDDGFYEGDETIMLDLQTISINAVSGTRLSHEVTILENDIRPSVTFATTTTTDTEAGLGTQLITIVMDATSSLAVGIDYLLSGSATDTSDYNPLSGYIEIPALATSTTLSITVLDDATVESDETIELTLSSVSSHAMIGIDDQHILTIVNDDSAPLPPPVPTPTPTETGSGGLPATVPTVVMNTVSSTPSTQQPTTTTTQPTTDPVQQPNQPNQGDPIMSPVTPTNNPEPNMCVKEVQGVCEPYLTAYIRFGAANDPLQVRKLQAFLRDEMNMSQVRVTGYYDRVSERAVRAFQKQLSNDVLSPWKLSAPTGYVYITTSRAINRLHCQKHPPKPITINTCESTCYKPISNYQNKTVYINVCKQELSCQALLTKSLTFRGKNDPAEVERLQVAINIALQQSRKPTRVFDQATQRELIQVHERYIGPFKGTPTFVGDELRNVLNGIWCEK